MCVWDCDKFPNMSLATSRCFGVSQTRQTQTQGPVGRDRTRCRLSSGEHLKINNISDDLGLLVTDELVFLRSDAAVDPLGEAIALFQTGISKQMCLISIADLAA